MSGHTARFSVEDEGVGKGNKQQVLFQASGGFLKEQRYYRQHAQKEKKPVVLFLKHCFVCRSREHLQKRCPCHRRSDKPATGDQRAARSGDTRFMVSTTAAAGSVWVLGPYVQQRRHSAGRRPAILITSCQIS